MRVFDWLVVIVMGVVGWLIVSFLLNRSKSAGQDAADDRATRDTAASDAQPDAEFPSMSRLPGPSGTVTSGGSSSGGTSASTASNYTPPLVASPDNGDRSDLLSLEEMGRAWSSILGVPADASGAQIEAAYHAKLAEYDRVRFDANANPASKRTAEQQRARVSQAYEFIRPSR